MVILSTFVPSNMPRDLKEVLKLSEDLTWFGIENQNPIHSIKNPA